MTTWFISDIHFGDDRFKMLNRPFLNLNEQHNTIITNWNNSIKNDDVVWVLGDVSVTDEHVKLIEKLNGNKHLIIGNYDEYRLELLKPYFKTIQLNKTIQISTGEFLYLNHYPEKSSKELFNLTAHIHSLWKVQRNMINVSVEVWNFKPVSEEEIIFCMNGIKNHYDVNVFAGELIQNKSLNVIYAGDKIEKNGPTIFLAGPTPRDKNVPSWRPDFIYELSKMGFKGTILVPEKEVYTEHYQYEDQIEWEDEGLQAADLIVFWVPRNLENMPAFTTNVEFGEFLKSGKSILGYPMNAEKMRYLHKKALKYDIPIFHDMNQICTHIVFKSKIYLREF